MRDHLPFGNMIMQIAGKMDHPDAPRRPVLRIKFGPQLCKEVLDAYFKKFEEAYKKAVIAYRKKLVYKKDTKK